VTTCTNWRKTFTRGIAVVVALFLLSQLAVLGRVDAFANSAHGTFFASFCTKIETLGSDKAPTSPNHTLDHEFCCVTPFDEAIKPPAKLELSYLTVFPAEIFSPSLVESSTPVVSIASKRSPQSPRAPPLIG
jgi:hypothetical protein